MVSSDLGLAAPLCTKLVDPRALSTPVLAKPFGPRTEVVAFVGHSRIEESPPVEKTVWPCQVRIAHVPLAVTRIIGSTVRWVSAPKTFLPKNALVQPKSTIYVFR